MCIGESSLGHVQVLLLEVQQRVSQTCPASTVHAILLPQAIPLLRSLYMRHKRLLETSLCHPNPQVPSHRDPLVSSASSGIVSRNIILFSFPLASSTSSQ